MDGERLNGEVVFMDNDYKEKLQMEEHVLIPWSCVCVSREDLETFGFTARCRQAHADGIGVEEHSESRGSTKTLEGVSGQGNREMNETNEVEH